MKLPGDTSRISDTIRFEHDSWVEDCLCLLHPRHLIDADSGAALLCVEEHYAPKADLGLHARRMPETSS
jgi:hypothetical protein